MKGLLRFENRLVPIDGTIWGAMAAEAQLKGIVLALIDGLSLPPRNTMNLLS